MSDFFRLCFDLDISRWIQHESSKQQKQGSSTFAPNTSKTSFVASLAHAFEAHVARKALGTRVNPDIIVFVWTGEFDLNTLSVDGDFFEFGKKKLRIQKYRIRVAGA